METTHRVTVGDARTLTTIDDNAVELVVTSPPYPMIELWDELFTELDPAVSEALAAGDGRAAFEAMHAELDPIWAELDRVLVEGGIACINIGDATRTLGGTALPVWPIAAVPALIFFDFILKKRGQVATRVDQRHYIIK